MAAFSFFRAGRLFLTLHYAKLRRMAGLVFLWFSGRWRALAKGMALAGLVSKNPLLLRAGCSGGGGTPAVPVVVYGVRAQGAWSSRPLFFSLFIAQLFGRSKKS